MEVVDSAHMARGGDGARLRIEEPAVVVEDVQIFTFFTPYLLQRPRWVRTRITLETKTLAAAAGQANHTKCIQTRRTN